MLAGSANKVLIEIQEISKREKKRTAFCIETTANINNHALFFPPIRITEEVVSGVAKVYNILEVEELTKLIDGKIDYVFVDAETKVPGLTDLEGLVRKNVKLSKVLALKVNDYTAAALDALISQKADFHNKSVSIIGAGNIGGKLALKLIEKGFLVKVVARTPEKTELIAGALKVLKTKECKGLAVAATSMEASKDATVLVGLTQGISAITAEMVSLMKENGLIIDGGIGCLTKEAISLATKRGISLLRLDARAGFAGQVCTMLKTEEMVNKIIGKKPGLVAGGEIGSEGDVIVDSIISPKAIFGLCDGLGGIKKELNEKEVQKLMQWKQKLKI